MGGGSVPHRLAAETVSPQQVIIHLVNHTAPVCVYSVRNVLELVISPGLIMKIISMRQKCPVGLEIDARTAFMHER